MDKVFTNFQNVFMKFKPPTALKLSHKKHSSFVFSKNWMRNTNNRAEILISSMAPKGAYPLAPNTSSLDIPKFNTIILYTYIHTYY